MMGMYFLVLCSLGVLRPVRNALALDGIGGPNFYRVYIVSAAVIFVAPLVDRLSQRLAWRQLIPGAALTFAVALVVFRGWYTEGSATLGYAFYGFYDVCSAVLVTLFFISAQLSFDAREARTAYPMIIAAGSLGATVGGVITGFFSDNLGTENLLVVSAGLLTVFAVVLPLGVPAQGGPQEPAGLRRTERPAKGTAADLLKDPHVRLIAISVLLMVLVKQLVDYQFNALTKEAFETIEAVTAFQGKFNAATQWLPFAVLLALRPGMKRWGVGLALFLLPVAMLAASAALVLWWNLWSAVGAQATEMTLRNSAERSAREVLYVPLSDDMKPRAKAYIDATLADGVGKVASVALIGAALSLAGFRSMAWVALALCVVWLGVTVLLRREYVATLARSIRGRYASFRGIFASLGDASSVPVVEGALASGDTLQASFALDLVSQGEAADISRFSPQLHGLLTHDSGDIRERAFRVLEKAPDAVDTKRVEAGLTDVESSVREAAVRTLCSADVQGPTAAVNDLLSSPSQEIRIATLACLARGEIPGAQASVGREYVAERWEEAQAGSSDERLEMALAAGAMGDDPEADDFLSRLLEDPDPRVASAALTSAGLLNRYRFYPQMIAALGVTGTRRAAMEALRGQADRVVPLLSYHLLDPAGAEQVRLAIPNILSRMPQQAVVDALLESFLAPETDQFLDFRTLKALGRIRATDPDLEFDAALVDAATKRELEAATDYERALSALGELDTTDRGVRLVQRAAREAWQDRREGLFRCLALTHEQDGMDSCYRALMSRSDHTRANALEWLEETVGRATFDSLAPVLAAEPRLAPGGTVSMDDAFYSLWCDNDTALAYFALRLAAELKFPWMAERVDTLVRSQAANRYLQQIGQSLGDYASTLVRQGALPTEADPTSRSDRVDPIEKIFLLQNVDVLREASTSLFALLASIAEEVEAEPGTVLLSRGEPPDALYVVVEGSVALDAGDGLVMTAEVGRPFGTWALIDQSPSIVTANVSEPTRLVRITRDDFHDLLADYPELATELLQGLARKVRALVQ